MTLSRRSFLLSGVAALAVPAFPGAAAALPPVTTPAPVPATTIWICGTPGEFDWRPFDAPTREAAWRQFCRWRGHDEDCPVDDACIDRAAGFDGKHPDDIGAADWIANGLGACCDRCGYETHDGNGGRVIGCEAVCEDCLTLAERIDIDRDGVLNDLVCDMCDDGAEAVYARLVARGEWDEVPVDLWAEAIAAAAAEGGAA